MEKKNTGIIVLIVVLALLLGLLGGYIITDKLIKENDTMNNDNPNKNEDQNNNTTVTFTMDDAKKLMESYKVEKEIFRGSYYIFEINGSNYKYNDIFSLAIPHVKFTVVNIEDSWVQKMSDSIGLEVVRFDGYLETGKAKIYKHSDLENYLKTLFGPNYSLKKTNFYGDVNYYYSPVHDGFVGVIFPAGGDPGHTVKGTVLSVSQSDNDVHIIADRTFTRCEETEPYETWKYEYVFKKSNNSYYLSEIKDLNN